MSTTEIQLLGAPDAYIGSAEAKHHGLQVMQVDLTDEVLDDLKDAARSGKLPQIVFGKTPSLRYGDKTQVLDTCTEVSRHELYSSEDTENLSFAGVIGHHYAVQIDDIFAGVDMAREALENNLRMISQEKDARKTVLVDDGSQPNHHRRNLSARSNLLKPSTHLNTPGRSIPSSPAFGTINSPRTGPTSAPSALDAVKQKAIRRPLIHLLAVQPRSIPDVTSLLRCKSDEAKAVLEKVAKVGDKSQYTLSERSFKELDVFEFPYKTDVERQTAIDNAVRSFDRLRLATDDKLWQKLLPKEERGKGKCLSRLIIKAPAQPTAGGAKTTKKPEKKEAPPKKETAAKKTEVKDAKKSSTDAGSKKATKPSEKPVEEKPLSALQEARRKKKEFKSAAIVPKEDQVKAGTPRLSKPEQPKSAAPPPAKTQKATKPASKPVAKPNRKYGASSTNSLLNKPKNPSPLSASPPVNASDFAENHPIHKALSASTSPAKASTSSSGSSDIPLKRKANDLDNNIHSHSISKARKVERDTSQTRTPVNGFKPGSQNSTPSLTSTLPNSLKRKTGLDTDSSSTTSGPAPTKRPRLNNVSVNNGTSSQSPSSDSPTSPVTYSYQQTIQLSQRFQTYYAEYLKLHQELTLSSEPPSKTQRDKLYKMTDTIARMKQEIRTHAARNI